MPYPTVHPQTFLVYVDQGRGKSIIIANSMASILFSHSVYVLCTIITQHMLTEYGLAMNSHIAGKFYFERACLFDLCPAVLQK